MDKTLTIRILTPEGTLYEGAANAVFLPGSVSPFEVLPGHAPIISALSAGDIRVAHVREYNKNSLENKGIGRRKKSRMSIA